MSRPENENPRDRSEETARELRKHPPRPSEALISRIERLAERGPAKRSHSTQLQFSRRKLVLALAAALAISVAGAIVAGELRQPSSTVVAGHALPRTLSVQSGIGTDVSQFKESVPLASGTDLSDATTAVRKAAAASGSANPGATSTTSNSAAQITSGKRLAELRAVLTLKVENSDELSRKTAQAMKIARSLSGYVVSAQVDSPSRGIANSYLVLKVPAARSQEALIRISELGKILSQQVSLEDVKATVTAQGKTIAALKREIASLEQTLSQQTLTSQARSQLQVKLARDRAKLSSLQTQRTKDILRGRLATITLTLTTGDLPKLPIEPSRIQKAIDRAWDGLSSEISWAAMGLIVASPFLLLAALLALALRSRRRREERRLLEK
ncbi:MAG TPA: DUF4349 domain-containing protein [Gaiellaceae bacterium]|jgi:Domain of unknown function (DUF4349)